MNEAALMQVHGNAIKRLPGLAHLFTIRGVEDLRTGVSGTNPQTERFLSRLKEPAEFQDSDTERDERRIMQNEKRYRGILRDNENTKLKTPRRKKGKRKRSAKKTNVKGKNVAFAEKAGSAKGVAQPVTQSARSSKRRKTVPANNDSDEDFAGPSVHPSTLRATDYSFRCSVAIGDDPGSDGDTESNDEADTEVSPRDSSARRSAAQDVPQANTPTIPEQAAVKRNKSCTGRLRENPPGPEPMEGVTRWQWNLLSIAEKL